MLVGDPVDGKFTTFVTFDYGKLNAKTLAP
jgi:hypothetical protein